MLLKLLETYFALKAFKQGKNDLKDCSGKFRIINVRLVLKKSSQIKPVKIIFRRLFAIL